MRYMILIAGDEKKALEMPREAGEQVFAAYIKYTEELKKAGVMLAGAPLEASARGARVGTVAGKRVVTDGPFSEAKEVVGGYYLIQVKSKEEAIEWASRCPAALHGHGAFVEVREVTELGA